MRHAEESARGRAMDEFLAAIHVEERFYIRETRTLFVTKKTLVRQERIFFRNIPLSSWVEHDMPVDEEVNGAKRAQALPDPGREVRIPAGGKRGKKLLR